MQQHAEPVDRLQSAPPGRGKQRRLQRHIDDVGDDGAVGQAVRIDGQLHIAMHTERRGVDQQAGIAEQFARRLEPMRRNAGTEAVGQLRRAGESPVDDADILETTLLQRMDDSPRGSACAEHDGCAARRPAVRALVEIGGEPLRIGVAAAKHAVLEPQRVDRADAFRGLVAPPDRRKGCFLVRDRHIAAGKAFCAERRKELPYIGRRDIDRLVAAGDPVFSQPVAMDLRRPRMRDRVAADERLLAVSAIDGPEAHAVP